ncbi:MAG: hypothetical protein H0T73_15995 [Ardenticatenales bacterium]|nr:hypothetical protein [Ardenticatenales bacterium]
MRERFGALLIAVVLLVACGQQGPTESVATQPPVSPATQPPGTATALPEQVATEAVPEATLPPSEPTATEGITGTEGEVDPTGLPTPPEEAILIQVPGPGSRVTSPLHVEGMADSTFEQTLVARLVNADGVELALVPTTIQSELGQRGPFTVDIPFTIAGEENAFLQIFAASPRDGGLTHLSSIVVRLAASGAAEILPAQPRREDITIFSPRPGETVQGGVVRVEGVARASFEQSLMVDLVDVNGNTLARLPITVNSSEMGQPGPFAVEVPYRLAQGGPARLVVRDPSAAFDGTVHLSSIDIRLEP